MVIKTKKLAVLACAGLALGMTAQAQSLTPAEEGRRLYLSNNCYGCHGDVGGGSAYGAPILRREAELGDLSDVIREGGERGMPAFPKLNNTTAINYLSSYLSSLGTSTEPTFYLWWEPIPTAELLFPHVPYYLRPTRKMAVLIRPAR